MEEAKELIFRAWGIRLREDTEGKEWITRMGPTYGIASRFGYYGIHVADQCYVEDPEAVAEKIVDMRLQHILRTHQAWVAVDLMEVGEEIPSEEKAYTYIGQLLAELVDENCLGVYCPQTQRMNAYTPELVEKLRGPNPLEDLKEPAALPVLQVEEDDPRMKAAVEEAKSRWPEFVEAFQKRQSGENFAIKAPIRSGENCEFIWIEVTAMEGERIHGKILNEPLDLPGYAMNSAVTVELKDLNDWMVWDGEEMKGGFTAKVLGEVMKERRGEAPSAAASR
jgi:uncharacterized protein YegJ (DUF2314 family)